MPDAEATPARGRPPNDTGHREGLHGLRDFRRELLRRGASSQASRGPGMRSAAASCSFSFSRPPRPQPAIALAQRIRERGQSRDAAPHPSPHECAHRAQARRIHVEALRKRRGDQAAPDACMPAVSHRAPLLPARDRAGRVREARPAWASRAVANRRIHRARRRVRSPPR